MKVFSRFRKNSTPSTSSTSTIATTSTNSTNASLFSSSTATTKRLSLDKIGQDVRKSIERKQSNNNHHSSKNKDDGKRDSFEMVKRRVSVPVAIMDRPLTNEIEFIIDARYSKLKVIGSGSFGVVASAIDSISGERVAIKKILSAFSTVKSTRYVLREVRLLRHLKHPNIVKLLDIDVPYKYRSWDEVFIVTPLLKTDLKSALNKKLLKDKLIVKKICYQICSSLDHMHELGLMHRDIKSRNILLDNNFNMQLCDLGHSRFYSNANKKLDEELDDTFKSSEPDLTGAVTTMIQSAPEISLGSDYDVHVDIWAAACVIAEILHPNHDTLFDNTGKNSHIQEIFDIIGFPSDDDLKELPDHVSWFIKLKTKSKNIHHESKLKQKLGDDIDPQAFDLLTQMLAFSPKKRISAKQAMLHPWFDDVRESENAIAESHKTNDKPYDFTLSEPPRKSSKAELKHLMWNEVVAFHPEANSLKLR